MKPLTGKRVKVSLREGYFCIYNAYGLYGSTIKSLNSYLEERIFFKFTLVLTKNPEIRKKSRKNGLDVCENLISQL